MAKEVLQTDLPAWVTATILDSQFEEVSNVAVVVATTMYALDDEWVETATRPSFSEMLGEIGAHDTDSPPYNCCVRGDPACVHSHLCRNSARGAAASDVGRGGVCGSRRGHFSLGNRLRLPQKWRTSLGGR